MSKGKCRVAAMSVCVVCVLAATMAPFRALFAGEESEVKSSETAKEYVASLLDESSTDDFVLVPKMSAKLVQKMMLAMNAKAEGIGKTFTIVILGMDGRPAAMSVGEGKPYEVTEVAEGKATMSWWLRMPSEETEKFFGKMKFMNFKEGRHFVGVQGGVPLVHEGHRVGAIGVSGASGKLDKEVAEAGKAVFEQAMARFVKTVGGKGK